MKKYCKISCSFAIVICFGMFSLQAQDGEKMRDKLKMYKKIILIEKLNMNEEQSIKFFARYAEQEELIKQAKGELDNALEMLELTIESGKGDPEKAMQLVFDKDASLKKSIIDRMKAMKGVLSEKQYARYVLMEYSLLDKVKDAVKKKRKK